MTIITGGVVSVEDGTKKAEEYAPARKVRVEMHFAVPDGSDEGERLLDAVAALADRKVKEMLGQATLAKVSGSTAAQNAVVEATGKTKDDLAKEAGLPTEGSEPVKKAAGRPRKTVLTPPAAAATDELTAEQAQPEAVEDLFTPEPVKEITDHDLHDAARRKNEKLKNPEKIRKLVADQFGDGNPHQIKEIPQAKRAVFLKELEALT